jgi:uncharacterized protein YigE (DUF2233 family)
MKKKIRAAMHFCIAGLILSACTSSVPQNARSRTLYFHDHSFDVYMATYPKDRIRMFWKDDAGNKIRSLANLKSYAASKDQKLLFGCNGGMYMEDNSPLGLYIEKSKELARINLSLKGKSNFYLQPNGIFYLTDTSARVVATEKYIPFRDKALYATQSGPMLVNEGFVNKVFSKGSTNTTIRNGVGIDDKGRVVFAISDEPVNFYDFATFFKEELKCNNALFLDGSISRMYLPELGRNDLAGDFGVMIGVVK